jgi:hypothetical protein
MRDWFSVEQEFHQEQKLQKRMGGSLLSISNDRYTGAPQAKVIQSSSIGVTVRPLYEEILLLEPSAIRVRLRLEANSVLN